MLQITQTEAWYLGEAIKGETLMSEDGSLFKSNTGPTTQKHCHRFTKNLLKAC